MNKNYVNFDEDDFVPVEFISYNGLLAYDKYDMLSYIDSCYCSYLTYDFKFCDDDFTNHIEREKLLNICGIDRDQDDEDIDRELIPIFNDYRNKVEKLLHKYNIEIYFDDEEMCEVREYKLAGLFGDLKKFCNEYSSNIDFSDRGNALKNAKYDADIWLDSGDKSYLINISD